MVEKKIVIDNMNFGYEGVFNVVDFYKAMDVWIQDKNLEKELKKKLQHTLKKGRKIEWLIEIWDMPSDYAKRVVRLRALFNNIKDVKVNGKNMNNGDVLIVIDGILETDIEGKWHQKPTHYFLRAAYDKIFNKFYTNRFEGKLAADCYALREYLMEFFKKYK